MTSDGLTDCLAFRSSRPHPRHRSRRDPRSGFHSWRNLWRARARARAARFSDINQSINQSARVSACVQTPNCKVQCTCALACARSGSGDNAVMHWRRQRLAVLHGDDYCDRVVCASPSGHTGVGKAFCVQNTWTCIGRARRCVAAVFRCMRRVVEHTVDSLFSNSITRLPFCWYTIALRWMRRLNLPR